LPRQQPEDALVRPIGGKHCRQVDAYVVAATNVDLRTRAHSKQFRQDLFFRLAGYQISLPPLRERASDIPLLVEHFLTRLGGQMGRDKPSITREAMNALSGYHYPGNVRELKNLIEYALIASRGQAIGVQHLHFLEAPRANGSVPASAPLAAAHALVHPQTEAVRPVTSFAASDEDALIEHTRPLGKIYNAMVQDLLGVDHGRASYLLKKLHKEGRLQKQGERRWAYYTVG